VASRRRRRRSERATTRRRRQTPRVDELRHDRILWGKSRGRRRSSCRSPVGAGRPARARLRHCDRLHGRVQHVGHLVRVDPRTSRRRTTASLTGGRAEGVTKASEIDSRCSVAGLGAGGGSMDLEEGVGKGPSTRPSPRRVGSGGSRWARSTPGRAVGWPRAAR